MLVSKTMLPPSGIKFTRLKKPNYNIKMKTNVKNNNRFDKNRFQSPRNHHSTTKCDRIVHFAGLQYAVHFGQELAVHVTPHPFVQLGLQDLPSWQPVASGLRRQTQSEWRWNLYSSGAVGSTRRGSTLRGHFWWVQQDLENLEFSARVTCVQIVLPFAQDLSVLHKKLGTSNKLTYDVLAKISRKITSA